MVSTFLMTGSSSPFYLFFTHSLLACAIETLAFVLLGLGRAIGRSLAQAPLYP